ncbi:MAG: ribonuclease III [Planctomycetota bacterium]
MSEEMLDACERVLGYTFKDREWLHLALVHSSSKIDKGVCNERMEFLGDSILGMVVAQYLFQEYPDFTEGRLTKVKSVVVSRPVLARCAAAIELEKFIIVGPGMAGDALPETILADTFEAVIAAMYLDGGMEVTHAFILGHLEHEIDAVVEDRHTKNYKSLLQQLVQRKEGITPTYRVTDERGPDHAKEFCVAAVIGERVTDRAWGPSKRAAEQLAAEKTYKHLLAVYGTKDE